MNLVPIGYIKSVNPIYKFFTLVDDKELSDVWLDMKFSYGKAGNEYCLVTECSFHNTKVVYSVEKTVVKIDYDVLDLLLRLEKEYNVRFLLL